ncbi:tetratricopeptide repeat protein [Halomonas denitrificans]|nr:tetratricopeptide repeat protein [Halomonas denitrificans]
MRNIEIRGRAIDLEGGRIVQDGQERFLAPRLLALLAYFVEHAGDVLSRDDIIENVWGHLEAASDDSVNVAVSSLRRELGDTRRPHGVIVAVPRRGYRLVPEAVSDLAGRPMPVADHADSPAEGGTIPPPHPQRARGPRAGVALALAAALALAVAAPFLFDRADDVPSGEEIAVDARPAEPGGPVAGDPAPASKPAGQTRPSVVVLPFLDMSAGSDHRFFADGLVDRITHMLAQSPELEVVARTSAFAFQGRDVSIREVADRLGVDAVLEGSVQRDGDTVRVLAQLIETGNERHLWSRTYDRPLDDLFDVQDEIANLVSDTLTDTLLADTVTAHPENQQVHDLITRGRFAADNFTLASATEARALFERALELDPDNVEALVRLVDAIGMQRSQGPMRTREDVHDFTEEYIDRARRIDPDHPLVIRATGDWHFRSGRIDEAIASYRRAVELNPNDPIAQRGLGRILFRDGRYEDAIEPLRTAVRLDPFAGIGVVWLADAYWAQGRAEEALFRLRRIIRDRPDFPLAYDRLATYLAQTGETGEAMRYILRQRELDPDSGARWFRVCEFHLQLGDSDSARRCTDALAAEHDLPLRIPYLRQAIAAFEGDWDEHVEQLETIYALGNREPMSKALLAQAYSMTDCNAALEVLRESFPELFEAAPQVDPTRLIAAKTAVLCLRRQGTSVQDGPLLEALADTIERTRVEKGPWMVAGYERVWLLTLQGRDEDALDEFETLVRSGWRYYWWGLESLPVFDRLRDHPRFRAALEALGDGVAAQRAYFEQRRDEPLD